MTYSGIDHERQRLMDEFCVDTGKYINAMRMYAELCEIREIQAFCRDILQNPDPIAVAWIIDQIEVAVWLQMAARATRVSTPHTWSFAFEPNLLRIGTSKYLAEGVTPAWTLNHARIFKLLKAYNHDSFVLVRPIGLISFLDDFFQSSLAEDVPLLCSIDEGNEISLQDFENTPEYHTSQPDWRVLAEKYSYRAISLESHEAVQQILTTEAEASVVHDVLQQARAEQIQHGLSCITIKAEERWHWVYPEVEEYLYSGLLWNKAADEGRLKDEDVEKRIALNLFQRARIHRKVDHSVLDHLNYTITMACAQAVGDNDYARRKYYESTVLSKHKQWLTKFLSR